MCDGQVLQKLGKADETKDVAFEEGVINFNKQYVSTAQCLECVEHFKYSPTNYSVVQFLLKSTAGIKTRFCIRSNRFASD